MRTKKGWAGAQPFGSENEEIRGVRTDRIQLWKSVVRPSRAYRFDIVMASEEGVPLTKGRSIRHKNFAILIKQEVWVFSGG